MMAWRIGDQAPYQRPAVVAERLPEPEWYVLVSRPQREQVAKRWLKDACDAEVWYPTETVWRKQAGGRGKRPVERLVVPRYLFTRFERRPVWHAIFGSCSWLTGVVGVNFIDVFSADGNITRHMVSMPVPIRQKELFEMRRLPDRIRELEAEAAAFMKAQRDANMPKPGERVTLIDGPFEGYIVDVAFVENGLIHYLLDLPMCRVEGQSRIEGIDRANFKR